VSDPRVSLVVTTYDRPDALANVLATVAWQTVAPNQVLIADDGSQDATAALIAKLAQQIDCPLEHVRQPHAGFRAGRIRNHAIARARCEYIVLVDGDMQLHPRFIQDHVRAARPGWFMQGTRIQLDPKRTAIELEAGPTIPGPLARGLGGLRRCYGVRSTFLARACRRAANSFVAVKSCNQGIWRDDLVRVNGYDESMCGWGYEDKELCARLVHAGVRRGTLIFSALAYHLAHAPADRSALAQNSAILARTRDERRVRTQFGIDRHGGPGSAGPPGPDIETPASS
jgi:glycosyltransferase involved in cell wall biosynthesis